MRRRLGLALILAARRRFASGMAARFDVARHLRSPAVKTPYARPAQIGCFSRDADGTVHADARGLRRYEAPRLPASLAAGFGDAVAKRGDGAEAEAALIDAFRRAAPAVDFVTYRNNLNKLLGTPYNGRDAWEMGVSRLEGNAYLLSVRETAAKKREEANRSEDQRLWSYFGYKFEALCTAADPLAPVDPNAEYVGVFGCKLGAHRLCVAAEIDGADGDGAIELKTSKLLDSKRAVNSFERFKMFKFWVQSFLVGTEKVVVGFRDGAGDVRKIQAFETLRLPDLAHSDRSRPAPWSPRVSLHFADAVLSWLSGRVGETAEASVLRYDPPSRTISLEREGAPAAKRRRVS